MPLVHDDLTFFGLPRYSPALAMPPATILLGIPSSRGAPSDACENGPYFLRRLSQRHVWQSDRPDIIDLRCRSMTFSNFFDAGNIVATDDRDALDREMLAFGADLPPIATIIAIGGDHSITLPLVTMVAARDRPIKMVVFDHHLDFQYWSSEKDAPFNTNVMTHISDLLGPGRIVHIGVDPMQTVDGHLRQWYLDHLAQAGAQVALFSHEIDDNDHISQTVGTGQDIYLSIDVDVLGQGEMRSTGYPSYAGLTVSRTIELIRLIAAGNRIVGCDLVEFAAPAGDRQPHTLADAARASSILLELMIATTGSAASRRVADQHRTSRERGPVTPSPMATRGLASCREA